MAPLPCSLVGYRVPDRFIKEHRAQHGFPVYSNRALVQHLESTVGTPLALVRVELGDTGAAQHYLCCFVDYETPYSTEELMQVPTLPVFSHLPEVVPVQGDLCHVFAPRATFWCWDENGKRTVPNARDH